MAEQNFKLLFEFIAKTAQFNLNIDRAKAKIAGFSQQAVKTGKFLSTRLSLPLAAVGGLALRQAAKFERLQVTLNTLNGSADEGAKSFKRLVAFSAKTPLQLEELTRVNNMLMGFGQTSDDAFKSLKMLGDVAAVSGGNLTGIAVAFGQAAAEGRVMTRDLRQFINNGVPILDILAKSMGVARGEIMDLASEGKLSFEVLQDGFEFATGSQGRFNDGLKILSQTLEGLFSTLKDNVNIALAELGQEIATTLNLKEGIPALSEKIGKLVKDFKALDPETRKLIINAGILAVVIPPVTVALGAMAASITAITTLLVALSPLVIGIGLVISGLGLAFIAAKKEGIKFTEFLTNNLQAALISDDKFSRFNDNLGTTNDELKILNQRSRTAKKRLDDLAVSMAGAFTDPLGFSGARAKPFPTIPKATSNDGGGGGGTSDPIKFSFAASNMFAGFGKTVLDVSNLYNAELPKMTNVNNGFTSSMENMSAKFQDFKVNGIEPVIENFKTFGEQIIPQIGVALQEGFAAIADGENPLKRLGTILKGLVVRLMAAAAAAMLLGAFLGGATGGSAILTKLGGIKGLFTSFSGIEFANGGIVSGPTNALIGEYPGARSNPEVVAPLSKLKNMLGTGGAMQGEFVLRGQDLVVALQRAERNRNRFK